MKELNQSLATLVDDFKQQRIDLPTTLKRLNELIDVFQEKNKFNPSKSDLEDLKTTLNTIVRNISELKNLELINAKKICSIQSLELQLSQI